MSEDIKKTFLINEILFLYTSINSLIDNSSFSPLSAKKEYRLFEPVKKLVKKKECIFV